jgi:hypothetical protein
LINITITALGACTSYRSPTPQLLQTLLRPRQLLARRLQPAPGAGEHRLDLAQRLPVPLQPAHPGPGLSPGRGPALGAGVGPLVECRLPLRALRLAVRQLLPQAVHRACLGAQLPLEQREPRPRLPLRLLLQLPLLLRLLLLPRLWLWLLLWLLVLLLLLLLVFVLGLGLGLGSTIVGVVGVGVGTDVPGAALAARACVSQLPLEQRGQRALVQPH